VSSEQDEKDYVEEQERLFKKARKQDAIKELEKIQNNEWLKKYPILQRYLEKRLKELKEGV
jgi:hypothetical protein